MNRFVFWLKLQDRKSISMFDQNDFGRTDGFVVYHEKVSAIDSIASRMSMWVRINGVVKWEFSMLLYYFSMHLKVAPICNDVE